MPQDEKLKNRSHLRRLAPFASLLALAGCSSLLGIEEVHEGPAPGGGTGAESGADSTATGGTSSAGKGGSGGKAEGGNSTSDAGNNGDMAGEANAGAAGDSTQGGNSNGGNGNGGKSGGGSGGNVGGTAVTGHLIDYWGHKLPGIPVEIGGTEVTSDAQGTFTIANVPAEYDVSLAVNVPDTGETADWVFEGLTRRDPTLQVYDYLLSRHQYVEVAGDGLDSTLTGTRTFSVATAGPDGQDEFTEVVPSGFTEGSSEWVGPTATQATAYGLIWQPDSDGLPDSYVAFDSRTLALDSTSSTNTSVYFDLTADSITASAIVGTVSSGGSDSRRNYTFVQFPTNAAITLVSDSPKLATFSYRVPTLANGSMIFTATEGDANTGAFGLVHKDGLNPGDAGISALVPLAASKLAVTPTADVNKVSSTTVFSFQADKDNTGPFVVQFVNQDESSRERLYIVTAKTTFTLPKLVNGSNPLLPNNSYNWRVQTHGVLANVDAMAAPTGYMDEFSGTNYLSGFPSPTGSRHGDGTFSISAPQLITLAP